jgi:hypothetical protein
LLPGALERELRQYAETYASGQNKDH